MPKLFPPETPAKRPGRPRPSPERLAARRELVGLIVAGKLTVADAAETHGLSVRTIERWRAEALRELS